MGQKHIILIHGRATKPTYDEKWRLVQQALLAGLRRHSDEAAKRIEQKQVKLSFAYYGDLSNRLMIKAQPKTKEGMIQVGSDWFEKPGSYDDALKTLLARPNAQHTKHDYEALLAKVKDSALVDDISRVLSPLLSVFGLSTRLIEKMLPDLGTYLVSRVTGSEIRERLQTILRTALLDGDDVCLVSHSMGCMVSYDVLWKFSRMSEYKDVRDKKISLWLTLGNPLGEPAVKGGLYDNDEPEDGKYPANISHWVNIAAKDDFVAHDGNVADDFKDMLNRKLVASIEDLPRIYTFWNGREGSNPHKFYGYLNHPTVAERLVKWIL
jgi:hypothetical protein